MNKAELLGSTLAGIMILSGCASVAETNKTPTKEVFSTSTDSITVTPEATMTAELPTEVITPTEMVYSAEALAFVPHSVEEIANSVEVTSPIDNPDGYKEEFNDKIKPGLDQILTNYSGRMMNDGSIGINPETGSVLFNDGDVLNPIASVYFEWEGHQVPILYFPVADSQSKFVIGMIFSPTMSYYSGMDSNGKWVYDVTLDDVLKKFPMSISGNGTFIAGYTRAEHSVGLTASDPLFTAYFSEHEDPNYQTVLWNYFLGSYGKKLDFDRNYESSLLMFLNAIEQRK
jgi:hypothetical protein